MRDDIVCFGGGMPPMPTAQPPPPPPPPPLAPAAPPKDTQAQRAIGRNAAQARRRLSQKDTVLAGTPMGVAGDRPLGT